LLGSARTRSQRKRRAADDVFYAPPGTLPFCADMLYTRLRPAIAIAIDFSEEICGAPDASFVACVAYIGWLAT